MYELFLIMGRQPKAFRGQRKKERDHIGCGCFLCVGHDRSNKYVQKQKEADKEIIENDFIHSVSNFFHCQREEEMQSKCETQCEHCKEYYKGTDNGC